MAKKIGKKAGKKKNKPTGKRTTKKSGAPKKNSKKSAMSSVKTAAKKTLRAGIAKNKAVMKSVRKAPKQKIRGKANNAELVSYENSGLGARTGGQSGDTQGLSGRALTDSESVKELLEEGQSFEAEVLEGIENVPDADEGEIRTHEVPEDDVPDEYLGKDAQN